MSDTTDLVLDGAVLSIDDLVRAARGQWRVTLGERALERIAVGHSAFLAKIRSGSLIYGVNTGMGGLVDHLVPEAQAQELQENLIGAVATNTGPSLSKAEVRAVMLARINSLCRGRSGASASTVQGLCALVNSAIVPYVPELGSLGASGDLGPLASIALVAIGRGRAFVGDSIKAGSEALKLGGLAPLKLGYKEGLALINGTSAMTGVGSLVVADCQRLLKNYVRISCLSIEALRGKRRPFHPLAHAEKPHSGQASIAKEMFEILSQSALAQDESDVEASIKELPNTDFFKPSNRPIEDAYSVRCTPQLLGPVQESVDLVSNWVYRELNSTNDNPIIIAESDQVFHTGHFQGQYVSMAMDFLVIGLTTIANLSDRRTDRLLDPARSNGLPGFLATLTPGLHFGLMGAQFLLTSLTAENRTLCVPISVHTLPSTAGFQDIVSLGFIAARRARQVLQNTARIVAIEAIVAAQAAEIRGSEMLSPQSRQLLNDVRAHTPFSRNGDSIADAVESLSTSLLTTLYGTSPCE